MVSNIAYAHDVQNSEIRVVFGEDGHEGSVEIWQTILIETAYGVARSGFDQRDVDAALVDDDILEIIGLHSRVQAATGPCSLMKQAHRRVDHHGVRLQMRFLYHCPKGEPAEHITFYWMSKTPSNHFAVLEQNSGEGSPFKVIERGNPVFKFNRY
jgi:hypothetical protein